MTSRFSYQTRAENIDRLGQEHFDILVIGGGITGAGIARDASMRGFKTALIEKTDYGAGTSSKSSKLVHGGFRYLKSGHVGLVRQSLWERKMLMQLAPHLVIPQRCLIPVYRNSPYSPLQIRVGLALYDMLSVTRSIGSHRMLSRDSMLQIQPGLRETDLRAAGEYHDCTADDYRLLITTIQSAAEYGLVAANYTEAKKMQMQNGRAGGVFTLDRLSGKYFPVQSRIIVNAAGPWSDDLRRELFDYGERRLRLTKGVHIIVSRDTLPLHRIVMVTSIRDGRPLLSIPWKSFVIIGTTDTDYTGDPDNILTERDDVDYLLETFNYYFPKANLNDDKIISTFAGLRPLISEEKKKASEVSREYDIYEEPDNVFTIIGGKLTTYRIMAKELVDTVTKRLAKNFNRRAKHPKCRTHRIPLFGGDISRYDTFAGEWLQKIITNHPVDNETAKHLIETYGTLVPVVLAACSDAENGFERIHPSLPYLWGELDHTINYEMTVGLDDFLIRRTHLFSLDPDQGLSVSESIADRMAGKLNWTPEEKQAQIDRYHHKTNVTRYYRGSSLGENALHR